MRRLHVLWVLMLVSCSVATTQPIAVPTGNQYFWSATSDVTLVDQTSSVSHHLTFAAAADGLSATDAPSSGAASSLRFSIHSDSISVDALNDHTFIQLDPQTHLSALDTIVTISGAYVPTESMLGGALAPAILISTDSGGAFQFDLTTKTWISIGPKGVKRGAQLIQAHQDSSLYYVTLDNLIWHSSADRKTWTKLSHTGLTSEITKIVIDANSTLYAAIASGGIFVLPANATAWQPLSFLSTSVITALLVTDGSNPTIIAGTSTTGTNDGIVATLNLSSSATTSATLAGAGPVTCLLSGAGKFFAGTLFSGLWQSSSASGPWTAVTWSPRVRITSMQMVGGSSPTLFFSTDKDVYYVLPSSSNPLPTALPPGLTGSFVRVVSIPGKSTFMMTSTGVYEFVSGAWSNVHHGLEFSDTPDKPGALKLLAGPLAVGAEWRAGTLVLEKPTPHSLPLTARVIDHLEALNGMGDKKYDDVVVVRYSHELPGQVADTGYTYWTLYFQKGAGPVLIQRVTGSSVASSMVK